jgi:hypothetical protein
MLLLVLVLVWVLLLLLQRAVLLARPARVPPVLLHGGASDSGYAPRSAADRAVECIIFLRAVVIIVAVVAGRGD